MLNFKLIQGGEIQSVWWFNPVCLIYGEDDERLIFRFLNGLCFFCSVQIEIHLYTWRPFSFFGSAMFYSPILLLFYRSFHVFLTIAICIYLCFAGEVVFRFLAFGFISHTTRISNKTSFLCKRLVLKNIKLERIFPALQNWNVMHWTFKATGFNFQIILDFGKDLLLKAWL